MFNKNATAQERTFVVSAYYTPLFHGRHCEDTVQAEIADSEKSLKRGGLFISPTSMSLPRQTLVAAETATAQKADRRVSGMQWRSASTSGRGRRATGLTMLYGGQLPSRRGLYSDDLLRAVRNITFRGWWAD
jgi:hypothetical protein